jgi:serine protease Do
MVSPRPKTQGEFSVLGNTKLKVLKSVPRFLGIEPSYRVSDYQMLVVGLHPINMEVKPSQEDILIKDDLLKINDRNILSVEDMPAELAKFAIGETVKIQYRRDGGEPRTKSIIIEPRYVQPNQKSDWFKEGRSQRRDNFNEVLVHDGKLSPAECGGPLYDTHGQFYGINIARTSRTSTFTLPASVVLDFVKDVKLK